VSNYITSPKEAEKMTTAHLIQVLTWDLSEDLKQFYTPHRTNKIHKSRRKEQVLAIAELLRRSGEQKTTDEIEELIDGGFWPEKGGSHEQ